MNTEPMIQKDHALYDALATLQATLKDLAERVAYLEAALTGVANGTHQ